MFVKFGRNIGCQNVGIAVYLLFTLLFTSGVFAICFYWMHKKNTKYWIRFTGLAFYGLFPIWSAYARTAVKDTLFYPIFVLFVLFIFDIVLEPEKIFDSKVKSILFLIVSLLLCLVRHNGFYILIFTMPFCIVGVKKYRRQLIVLFIIMVAFWEVYQKAILPMAGVKPGGKQEMLSIPFQQTARYVKYYGNDVSTEEEKVIRKVLDYDTIGKNYDPDLSDPVKNTYKQKDEYLKDYSHWGYCDSDVIFGDLSKFLTDARLNTYDRIYQHGHLCIYKNEHNINYRWKTEHNLISYNYKEVFKVKGVKMFDERGGMWDIWKENQWSQYLNDKEFADILPTKHEFTTSWNSNPMCFHYQSGHLYKYKNGINKTELAYLHLQKRKMEVQITNHDDFFIKPNLFCSTIDASPISITQIKQPIRPNKLKRIVNICFNFDEIRFHIKVAFRRFVMYIKGENRHIKYELY